MSETTTQLDTRRYLRSLGITVAVLLTLMVTMNYLVDPYFIHQWDSDKMTRMSPPQQKIIPWAKTYAAYRYNPDVVLLGSSRTEIGLPTDYAGFAGKRVLNLAVSGASLADASKMLRHTGYFHPPKLAIWGLDYGWQFGPGVGNTDLNDDLIAAEPWYPAKRFLLNVKRSMSLKLTGESLKILLGTSDQKCLPMLATFGHKSDQCLEYIMADEGGTGKAFEKIVNHGDPSGIPKDTNKAMDILEAVTGEFCAKGTAFRFFTQPVHALAELSYWENITREQEQWKRDLTALFEHRRSEGCDIRLYDFAGYNRYTEEDIPLITGNDKMHYYWEYSHYNSVVGREVLSQMLEPGTPAAPGDFGAELTPATIERHLTAFRQRRTDYCTTHPVETANMRLCKISAG